MPELNVLSWNSNGETAEGARTLRSVLARTASWDWRPHVIVVQESWKSLGGPIYQVLADLGEEYNAPSHDIEMPSGGRGYLMCTHQSVAGQSTFKRVDLNQDKKLIDWLTDSLGIRSAVDDARQRLAVMQMPAMAELRFEGWEIPFTTWHVQRGPGYLLRNEKLPGGANPDAFLFLQRSVLYETLTGDHDNTVGFLAGDLNTRVEGFAENDWILPDWTGVPRGLDHLLCHSHAAPAPYFENLFTFESHSFHPFVLGTAVW